MNSLATVFHPTSLFRQMDRALGDLLGEPVGFGARALPPINAFEDEQAVWVEAELPGFKMDQIELTWERPTLTLRATRNAPSEADRPKFMHRERSFGSLVRSISFGREIDASNITASMTDGVLTIRLPKAPESQARRITIGVQNN